MTAALDKHSLSVALKCVLKLTRLRKGDGFALQSLLATGNTSFSPTMMVHVCTS